MRFNHFIFSVCVIAVSVIVMSGMALAGGGGMEGVPSAGGSVQGPEVWATIVLTCNEEGDVGTVSLHAKQIEDCNVETQSLMGPIGVVWACPQSSSDVINLYLPTLTLFERVGPVITKAKNFKDDLDGSGTISFNAQIKFWVPDSAPSN